MRNLTVNLYAIYYDVSHHSDQDGTFPLVCAALLFDVMGLCKDIVINNWCSINCQQESITQKYLRKYNSLYYQWDKLSKPSFSIWVKDKYDTNLELLDLLQMQTIDLRYIAADSRFDWDKFISDCDNDSTNLIISGEAKLVCAITDMDRELRLYFSSNEYTLPDIQSILLKWEKRIAEHTMSTLVERKTVPLLSEFGKIQRVTLLYR